MKVLSILAFITLSILLAATAVTIFNRQKEMREKQEVLPKVIIPVAPRTHR